MANITHGSTKAISMHKMPLHARPHFLTTAKRMAFLFESSAGSSMSINLLFWTVKDTSAAEQNPLLHDHQRHRQSLIVELYLG